MTDFRASPKFVTGAKGEVFHFEVRGGAVLVACDPASKKGCALQLVSAREQEIREAVEKIRNWWGSASAVPAFKVLGAPSAVPAVCTELQKLGIQVASKFENEDAFEVYVYSDSGRARVAPLARAPQKLKQGPVKVLIVDDSKTIRDLLSKVLSSDPEIQVVATAENPLQVEALLEKHRPDVVTLDIHMPEMDGVTLLRRYLPRFRIPTVMISSISLEEGNTVLSALEYGAVDYIQKPSFDQLKATAPLMIDKIKAAASARVTVRGTRVRSDTPVISGDMDTNKVIAIGSSTGGTEALRVLLEGLPDKIPPILITQHIPAVFSKAFALRMNELFKFEVAEAQNGDVVAPGRVLIAPGGLQMSVKRSSSGALKVVVEDTPPVNRHKPSVDVLFNSVATEIGADAVGVILTGMGGDGSKGLLKMRQAGARTIAQDESSCVVFGMPKEAIKLNAAESVCSLDEIAAKLVSWLSAPNMRRPA